VLFVSHNMGAVTTLCSRALWLDAGSIRHSGVARHVVNEYLVQGDRCTNTVNLQRRSSLSGEGERLQLETLEWLCALPLQHGEPVRARIRFRIKRAIDDATVGVGFSTLEGTRLLTYETDFQDLHRPSFSELRSYAVEVQIESLPLAPGVYSIDVGCRSGDSHALDYLPGATQIEVIPGPDTPGYIVRQNAGVRLQSSWCWTE